VPATLRSVRRSWAPCSPPAEAALSAGTSPGSDTAGDLPADTSVEGTNRIHCVGIAEVAPSSGRADKAAAVVAAAAGAAAAAGGGAGSAGPAAPAAGGGGSLPSALNAAHNADHKTAYGGKKGGGGIRSHAGFYFGFY